MSYNTNNTDDSNGVDASPPKACDASVSLLLSNGLYQTKVWETVFPTNKNTRKSQSPTDNAYNDNKLVHDDGESNDHVVADDADHDNSIVDEYHGDDDDDDDEDNRNNKNAKDNVDNDVDHFCGK